MKNESVAILDIRSCEVVFLLGSKGVNDTFVFYGSHTEKYDGFSLDGFYDVESFRHAVVTAVTTVRQNYKGEIGQIYIGVPSAFLNVYTKGHTVSFSKKRKIHLQDIDFLLDSGLNGLMKTGQCIRRSSMYFSLGDSRKYFTTEEVLGNATNLLQGALSYSYIDENFYVLLSSVLRDIGFSKPNFLPSSLAQALYLLPQKRREGYAFLLDIGLLTSSLSVVYGNAIVREESFDVGMGTVLVSLMETLNVEYAVAEEIMDTADISGGNVPIDTKLKWTSEHEDLSFPIYQINDSIKQGVDVLCEKIDAFFNTYYKERNTTALMVNPISITGEGALKIKGVSKHISQRLNRLTEVVAPDLPYYDKPCYSSRMALLDLALKEEEKQGWIYRFFNNFGGRKK